MALPRINFHMLLGLLALVLILNLAQFFFCGNNIGKIHPFTLIEVRETYNDSTSESSNRIEFAFEERQLIPRGRKLIAKNPKDRMSILNEGTSNFENVPVFKIGSPNANVTKQSFGKVTITSDSENEDKDTSVITPAYLELCKRIPPDLGVENQSMGPSKEKLSQVSLGGIYTNVKCLAQQNVAVIIPYDGNKPQLITFLEYLHPFLMKQESDYQVFVVECVDKPARPSVGRLLNIGFHEAKKLHEWQCLIFHEPSLLPLDSRHLYRCGWYPRQLVMEVQTTDNKTIQSITGGAVAVTPGDFSKINGFSNRMMGKDAEYYEFLKRSRWANNTLEKSDPTIAKYRGLTTKAGLALTFDLPLLNTSVSPPTLDGLTTLKYEPASIELRPLYTLIKVNNNGKSGKL